MANSPARTNAQEGTVVPSSMVAKFHASMRERAREERSIENVSEEIMEEQALRILASETAEEALKADLAGTVQCRDVPGTYWQINALRPVISNRDDIERSAGYYMTFDAVCLGGDADVMTRNGLVIGTVYPLQTSALLLMTKIRTFEALGELPVKLALIGIRTQSGKVVLKWGPMPNVAATA